MDLDIVIVGLCAIASAEELDCKHPTTGPASAATAPFDVVVLDPGLPQAHVPLLWVRVDGLETTPAQCWKGTESDPPYDLPPAADCVAEPQKKWARWDLAAKELRILQRDIERATLNQGNRKLAGGCWGGRKPGDGVSCVGAQDACKKDVSWLPEYAKVVNGDARILRAILADPAGHASVSAILRDVRGRLEAEKLGEDPWLWDWNYPSCRGDIPSYNQVFAGRAAIRSVHLENDALYLIDLRDGSEVEIKLASSPIIAIHNLPEEPVHLIKVGNKCYLPHFDLFAELLESAPTCRRVPYVLASASGECEIAIGMSDPFCPPLLLNWALR